MNKSNINELSAQTEADSNSTAQNQHVSQPNANTNVRRRAEGNTMSDEEAKFYYLGFKRAFQIMQMQIEASIDYAKSKNPEPNTPSQIFNDGRLKALYRLLTKVKERLAKMDNGEKVW